MSSTCINSMTETVVWIDASCVVSPVLLMCGSITNVMMTYVHTVLQRFGLLFSVVDEAYGTLLRDGLYTAGRWDILKTPPCVKTSLY